MDAACKAVGFFSHFAACAVQAQRQPNDDLANAVVAGNFPDAAHVFVAIDALEGGERQRGSGPRRGNGQANARAPIVKRKDMR